MSIRVGTEFNRSLRFLPSVVGMAALIFSSASHIRPVTAGELQVVGFDAPAIVVAEAVNPAVVTSPTTGGQLMRLRIPVSSFISPEFQGSVDEYFVEIESPHQSLRVIDFWPKNEAYSEVDGNVAVETSQQGDQNFSLTASAAYEPFGRVAMTGDSHNKTNYQERFQRKPPMQILTSSGTIRRGYGAFFKFRPGQVKVLEGAREVALLVEVPLGWRADLLKVTMRATGTAPSSSRVRTLGGATLWMTTHREGDGAAAVCAQQYVRNERALRGLAASQQHEIAERALPTVWHKLGAAIDVIDPRIPSDYLTRIIFGPADERFENGTNRLPVDLRVAVLDFWDRRQQLLSLAFPSRSTQGDYVVAKPIIP